MFTNCDIINILYLYISFIIVSKKLLTSESRQDHPHNAQCPFCIAHFSFLVTFVTKHLNHAFTLDIRRRKIILQASRQL